MARRGCTNTILLLCELAEEALCSMMKTGDRSFLESTATTYIFGASLLPSRPGRDRFIERRKSQKKYAAHNLEPDSDWHNAIAL